MKDMNSSAAPSFSSRSPGARLTAALCILLAASWGPFSQTLRLIEVSDVGKPGAEPSIRIVFARDLIHAKHTAKSASNAGAKPDAKSENTTTERLLNAVPETLEAAHSIHFDLSGVPTPERACAWTEFIHSAPSDFSEYFPEPIADIFPPVRGPPAV